MASICFSKLALITFVRGLTIVRLDRRLAISLEIFIAAWTIVGILGMAFACNVPQPWDYLHQQCFNTVRRILDMEFDAELTMIDCLVELLGCQQYRHRHSHSRAGHHYHRSDPYKSPEESHFDECIRLPSTVRIALPNHEVLLTYVAQCYRRNYLPAGLHQPECQVPRSLL